MTHMRFQNPFPMLVPLLIAVLWALGGVWAEYPPYPNSWEELKKELEWMGDAQKLAEQIKSKNDTNLIAMLTRIVVDGQTHRLWSDGTERTESIAPANPNEAPPPQPHRDEPWRSEVSRVVTAMRILCVVVDEETYLPLVKPYLECKNYEVAKEVATMILRHPSQRGIEVVIEALEKSLKRLPSRFPKENELTKEVEQEVGGAMEFGVCTFGYLLEAGAVRDNPKAIEAANNYEKQVRAKYAHDSSEGVRECFKALDKARHSAEEDIEWWKREKKAKAGTAR